MKPEAGATGTSPATGSKPSVFSGRDLSWLRFDERVIEVAEETTRPIFDRIRFLAISAANLDEFFMKRVALLRRRIEIGVERVSHDGRTVRQQLEDVCTAVQSLQERQDRCWRDGICTAMEAEGIRLTTYNVLSDRNQRRVDRWFSEQVFPLLTPLAVDPGHPFPFISNMSLNLGVLVSGPDDETPHFARLKIPDMVPAFVHVPTSGPVESVEGASTPLRVLSTADVVRNNLDKVFSGMRIDDVLEFRVTRSVGLEDEDDDIDDLFESVEATLRHRRFAEAVRLETGPDGSGPMVQLLLEELDLDPASHFIRRGPMDCSKLNELAGIDRPDLRSPRWKAVTPPRLRNDDESIFDVLRRGDLLVHHPYESFRTSVERFIAEAADDPDVVAIKQSLYRTDPDSPFIHSLLRAAEAGKQVACLVELRARFDEGQNLQLTRLLEKHGVHVTWGVLGLKTHAKCALVVRRERDGFRSYGHVGSGNYHPVTAKHYCDVGLLTSDPAITGDLTQLFNYLTGRSRHDAYEQLLVGPSRLRSTFESLIETEIAHARAGRPCGIRAKMNQLEDRRMIELIMRASSAGVPVELIVRGFCCLNPGIADLTENVRIRSIVGDFLEHSRIFNFRDGHRQHVHGRWYIGSADWMERNLSNRVEVLVPVTDATSRSRLNRILETSLADSCNAWDMRSDGTYQRACPAEDSPVDGPARLGSFDALCRDAMAAEVDAIAKGGPVQPEAGEPETPRGVQLPSVDRMLGLVLLDEPWRTSREIAARAGVSAQVAARAAGRLEHAGLLKRHDVGRTRFWEPTPLLADAVGGPMLPLYTDESWTGQWLRRRVVAWVERAGGERRVGRPLIERRPGQSWTVWGFFESMHGIRDRLEACLSADVPRVELVARDRDDCLTLHKRASKLLQDGRHLRVRTVAAVVAETAVGV